MLVLGAGPVGQTAALLLARWGLPVVMLDRRPARDLTGSKAICQQRDVLDVWAAVGCEAIAAEGLTWTTSRTYYRDRELFSARFGDPGRSPLPPFVNLSQARTEEILDERIAATPLIDTRWGHEVVHLTQDEYGVAVKCADGTVVRGSHAIACTGARGGAVREALGLGFDGESYDDRFLICDIRAELPGWESERRFYFDPEWNPGRQVLMHPCPGSVFRIDWQVPPDFDLEAEEASGMLDRRIRHIVGDQPYELVWRSVYRFHSRLADRMSVGRVLLAGDCAHLVAPFGARGLNSGVPDAENAAWKIAFVRHGWAPEALLATYHDERRAAALENLWVTGATMRFLVPRTPAERRRRQAILERAAVDPEGVTAVDSGRFAEPFRYTASPLTTRDGEFTGRAAAPGVILPDVPVSVPGRPEVSRLRHLTRDGVLVLLAGGCDRAAVTSALADAVSAPVQVTDIGESGALSDALGTRPHEVWVIRPDAHIAAILTNPTSADLTRAVLRALGHPTS
ncbi:FAD-dependent oxidoreductase [Sinosporangium siamense]|uniref:FAD-dependent oxidoreductase n=1 Tax=Sinosporangium siamense TaxID=1367973 RepID=A0A919RNF2_9ACTN|nr:FAD-dependent oxidoreductase [Sinosporangium siamense]